MAESTGPVDGGVACRYLYHLRSDFAPGHRVRRHRHPHAQLERIERGRVLLETDPPVELRAGQAVLLAAGCDHGLRYLGRCRGLSVKFAITGRRGEPRPLRLDGVPAVDALLAAADGCLPQDRAEPPPAQRQALEHVLAAVVALALPPPPAVDDADPLVARVAALLRAQAGAPVSVADLAAAVELSPSRLSARLRAATGRSAKQVIDRARSSVAVRLLRHGDHDVAGVAELMGFPDPFTFSRFVRRTTGRSPRSIRLD